MIVLYHRGIKYHLPHCSDPGRKDYFGLIHTWTWKKSSRRDEGVAIEQERPATGFVDSGQVVQPSVSLLTGGLNLGSYSRDGEAILNVFHLYRAGLLPCVNITSIVLACIKK